MKAIFIHDHKISVRDNKLYSNGGINKGVVNRYLSVFDSIAFATRLKDDSYTENLTLIGDRSKIQYFPMKDLAKLKYSNYSKNYQLLSEVISQFDFAILRLPSLMGLLGLKIAKKKNIPYAIEVVGCANDSYKLYGGLQGLLISYPMFYWTKKSVWHSNNVLYVTSSFLQGRYPSKANNQINCSNVEIVIDDTFLDKRKIFMDDTRDRIKLGMMGALGSKYKGFDTAIKAMSNLIDLGHKGYFLEIVGGGDSDEIVNLIKKHNLSQYVKIIGTLSHPDGIFAWLDSIDIYLHPSRVEGLPRALIEAMSRACPCVGANVGGIPELLDEEVLHEKDDYNRLTELVLELKESSIAMEQSLNNFNKAKEYSKVNLDQKRTEFYRQAITL